MKTKKWRRLIVATVLSSMLTMHGYPMLSYAQVNEQEAAEESVPAEENNAGSKGRGRERSTFSQ